MKTERKQFWQTMAFAAFVCMVALSCKKQIPEQIVKSSKDSHQATNQITAIQKTNPYSLVNIKNAMNELGRNVQAIDGSRLYYYFKFNPQKVNANIIKILEQDPTCKILDYPFADANLYDEKFQTQTNIEAYKDGNMYIVFNSLSKIATLFENEATLDSKKLDELYLPEIDDEDLQLQALITSGFIVDTSLQDIKTKLPCLLKKPHGNVTYLDQEDGVVKPVPQIKVWALVLGIPVITYTDLNGHYEIPWPFSVGTYIGTHAENYMVKVKPLDMTGLWLNNIINISNNFILGSQYSHGWYGACDMKNDINIHFDTHTQTRYWAQILHGFQKHFEYTNQDNISHAPLYMTVYAEWTDAVNTGAASTMMLGHMQTNAVSSFTNLCTLFFNTNLSVSAPNLFQILSGLLPDMTLSVSANQASNYSQELMQTIFHELGHASLFQNVGQLYWANVIAQISANVVNYTSASIFYPYGDGSESFAGLIQVNESWAEFIGKEYHRRFHPNGETFVWSAGFWQPYPQAIENDKWFANDWINTGVFYDLLDPKNEFYDSLSGYSIHNMYNCIGPNTNGLCSFKSKFIQNNPGVILPFLNNLMTLQNDWNGQCY